MAVREELVDTIDKLTDEVAILLNQARNWAQPVPAYRQESWPPSWVGAGRSGCSDTSERIDEFLKEGFGR